MKAASQTKLYLKRDAPDLNYLQVTVLDNQQSLKFLHSSLEKKFKLNEKGCFQRVRIFCPVISCGPILATCRGQFVNLANMVRVQFCKLFLLIASC